MASQAELDFIALIKEKIGAAKFTDGIQSFNFCRGKFTCTANGGYSYNMFLRISEGSDGYFTVGLDFPKSSESLKSNHEFFRKLQARILALCADDVVSSNAEPQSKFRTSLPSQFD